MKMPVRVLSLVLAVILFVPIVAHAEIDLSEYSTTELIILITQANTELFSRENAKFSVPMGEYIIGVDIPAGTYTLTIEGLVGNIAMYSEDGRILDSYLLMDGRDTVGKVELQVGQRIEISNGPITFSTYKGLGF